MFIRKKISFLLLLAIIPFTVLFYNVSQSMNDKNTDVDNKENGIIEYNQKIESTIIEEGNNLICNSSSGVCGPPQGWYSKD